MVDWRCCQIALLILSFRSRFSQSYSLVFIFACSKRCHLKTRHQSTFSSNASSFAASAGNGIRLATLRESRAIVTLLILQVAIHHRANLAGSKFCFPSACWPTSLMLGPHFARRLSGKKSTLPVATCWLVAWRAFPGRTQKRTRPMHTSMRLQCHHAPMADDGGDSAS